MGYCPHAQRSGSPYYLPVPCMQIGERFTNRVLTTEVPLQDGVVVGSANRGSCVVTVQGLMVVGNPQNVVAITDITIAKQAMLAFFQESKLPFTFYWYRVGSTLGGIDYPPSNSYIFYRNCYCQGVDFSRTNRDRKILQYTLTFLVPDGTEWKYDV